MQFTPLGGTQERAYLGADEGPLRVHAVAPRVARAVAEGRADGSERRAGDGRDLAPLDLVRSEVRLPDGDFS